MVTWENYEEYMILHVDGELSDAEQKALLDFIQLHPELQDDLKMYQATILMPDINQVYENKNALLKPVPAGRVIPIGQLWKFSAAAAIIFFVCITVYKISNHEKAAREDAPVIAKTEQKQPTNTPVAQRSNAPTFQRSNNATKSRPTINTPVIRREESISIARNSVHSNTKNLVKESASSHKAEIQAIRPVIPQLEVRVAAPVLITQARVVDIIGDVPATKKEDFLAWLPVNSEKKEGLRGLKENISAKVEQAKKLPETIKETALALKIGNKEFTINF